MKLLLTLIIFFQSQEGHWNAKRDVAISGYDVVSYFDDEPKEGNKDIYARFEGTKFLFSSEANKKKFQENPSKYIPAYGGWCAYAMGKTGEKVKIDPETYKITNGKLYLFYNFWGNNTLKSWNKEETSLMKQGDKYWNGIIGSK